MNIQESDILNLIITNTYTNQRRLAEVSGHSLGIVNRSIRQLISEGYLDESIHPTEKAVSEIQESAPKRAIILAAGFGMRMVPINTETPKGLLEVHGEPLIERQIRQLHTAGIHEIYVVVGFMKEQYEYLIDDYGVELIVNADYASKNNLHSLYLAREHLANAYIIPCDIWCDCNPFQKHELYSWYMVSDLVDNDSSVRVNRRLELTTISHSSGGNSMIGISYLLTSEEAMLLTWISMIGLLWSGIMLLAGMQSVSTDLYEAADIDGATTFQKIRYITIPAIRSVSTTVFLLLIIWTIKDYAIAYVLTKGGPSRATELLTIYIQQTGFKYFDFGKASAAGMLMLLVALAFTFFYFKVLNKEEE